MLSPLDPLGAWRDLLYISNINLRGLEVLFMFCPVPIVTPEIRLIALGYYCSSSLNDVSLELDLDSSSISDKRPGPEEAVEVRCLG